MTRATCVSCATQSQRRWQPRPPVGRGLRPAPTLNELERAYMEYTLHKAGGNKSHAARLLGISRETLRRRFREWEDNDRPAP